MFDLLGEIKRARQEAEFRRWLDVNVLMAAGQGEGVNNAGTVATLAEAFYRHLCGPSKATHCCSAPAGRYCRNGERLRAAYYQALQAGKRSPLGQGTAKNQESDNVD